MNINNFTLLDVKKASSANNMAEIDLIVTVRRRSTGKILTSRITPDMPMYQKLSKAIDDFQMKQCSQHTFMDIAIQAALSDTTEALDEMTKTSKILSKHLSIRNGHLYVDDKLVNRILEKHVLNIMHEYDENKETEDNWISLINFVEKLYSNQSDFVRNQFYGWLDYQTSHGKITLTRDGNLIAYKGIDVYTAKNGKRYPRSFHSGHGFVNGVEYSNCQLPNNKGDVIEMPRDEVNADPNQGCHIGLHVGTWDYASEFGNGNTIIVEVDPADIVSVPNDCNFQKIRVAKYKVIDVAMKELDETVFTKATKPDKSAIPDFFVYMEYTTPNGIMTFTKDNLDFDFDTETVGSICAYDAETDHYYKFDKFDMTFFDKNNHVVELNSFSKPESSFDHDYDKINNFEIPDDYAMLSYVSERGNTHLWNKDDITIVNESRYTITIYSDADAHYYTLHKENIEFLQQKDLQSDTEDEDNGITDDNNSDDVVSHDTLSIPGIYTNILYLTVDGEPRNYPYTRILSCRADNEKWLYIIQLTNGAYKTLDADRTIFIEPTDKIQLENDDLLPVTLPNGDVVNDVAFIVQNDGNKTSLITSDAHVTSIPKTFEVM